jgi:hypothetical protein
MAHIDNNAYPTVYLSQIAPPLWRALRDCPLRRLEGPSPIADIVCEDSRKSQEGHQIGGDK